MLWTKRVIISTNWFQYFSKALGLYWNLVWIGKFPVLFHCLVYLFSFADEMHIACSCKCTMAEIKGNIYLFTNKNYCIKTAITLGKQCKALWNNGYLLSFLFVALFLATFSSLIISYQIKTQPENGFRPGNAFSTHYLGQTS